MSAGPADSVGVVGTVLGALGYASTPDTPDTGSVDLDDDRDDRSSEERLRERVDELEEQLHERERELAEKQSELERVKHKLGQQQHKNLRLEGELETADVDGRPDNPCPHTEAVAKVVDEHGTLAMADLYDKYTERVDDPRSKRSVRNYLADLRDAGRVEFVGNKRGREYRPADGTDQRDRSHPEIVAEIVDTYGPVGMGELYDEYAERVDTPRSERAVRNYLSDLRDGGRVEFVGEKGGRTYRTATGPETKQTALTHA